VWVLVASHDAQEPHGRQDGERSAIVAEGHEVFLDVDAILHRPRVESILRNEQASHS
jgi:hypothetical protein